MCAVLRVLLFSLVLPVCASAQPAPTVVTTLITTNTGATSACVGSTSKSVATACSGGAKVGTLQFPTSVMATANGTLQKTAAAGLTVLGVAGVTYDFAVYNPSGGSPILTNPTGSTVMTFPGGSVGIGTTSQVSFLSDSTTSAGTLTGGTFGTGNRTGSSFLIGANSSGNGAAGILNLHGLAAASNFIWADASGTPGVLRISTAAPEEDGTPSDTSGTVVGSQASSLDTKRVLGAGVTPQEALAVMLRTPTVSFAYRGGSYSGTVFNGIVTDWSPEFGMDPDAEHPNGRSFNPVNALGYTVQAIKALQAEIDALKAEIQALRP